MIRNVLLKVLIELSSSSQLFPIQSLASPVRVFSEVLLIHNSSLFLGSDPHYLSLRLVLWMTFMFSGFSLPTASNAFLINEFSPNYSSGLFAPLFKNSHSSFNLLQSRTAYSCNYRWLSKNLWIGSLSMR